MLKNCGACEHYFWLILLWTLLSSYASEITCILIIVAGFKEQIYDVYRYLPPATQVCLISATLPHEILEMTSKFMTDPIRILVKRLGFSKFNLIKDVNDRNLDSFW